MNQFFRLVYCLKYAKKETAIRILLGLGIVGAQFSQTWFLAKMVIAVCEKRDMKEILLCYQSEFNKVSGIFSEKICGKSEE